MQSRKVTYYPLSPKLTTDIRKDKICEALIPVLRNKLKARTEKEPGLIFKVIKLNKLATKSDIDRLVAIFRHYLKL